MTTREVADYLRIKERRVYDLVRQGAIPCTRVTGKWLFPRSQIDEWVRRGASGGSAEPQAPAVIAGSHDPLLDWAVRESGCGLALLPGGSLDGLRRFAEGAAVASGLHLYDPESESFNVSALAGNPPRDAALLEWAWRNQGLVVAAGNPKRIEGLADLAREDVRVVVRQPEAGSHLLMTQLLSRAGLSPAQLRPIARTARAETDLGLAIIDGQADVGLAVEAVARTLKLEFLPLVRERYDLLVSRRAFFEPPLQRLFTFARSSSFLDRAREMGGYDVAGLGRVVWNAS